MVGALAACGGDMGTTSTPAPTASQTQAATPQVASPQVTPSPEVNQHTEPPTALLIAEWGVSLPLSSDIADAYYVAAVSAAENSAMLISLRSLESRGCAAA